MENIVTLVLFLSVLTTTFNRGFFTFPGFFIVCVLTSILVVIFFSSRLPSIRAPSVPILSLVFVCIYTIFLFFSEGIYQTQLVPSVFLVILPFLFYPLVLTFVLPPTIFPARHVLLRLKAFFILAFILRMLVIIASPHPVIDVFTMLKEAPIMLVHGINPYAATYSPVYAGIVSNYFTYFPFAFLLQIPFILLFGDPRVLLAGVDICSALLLFFLGRKTQTAQLLALIYLYRPNSLFIIEQSWVTHLAFFFLLLMIFFLEKKNAVYLGITTAAAILIQPINAVFFSIIFLFDKIKMKFIFTVFFISLITIAPFLYWNAAAFISDTFMYFFLPQKETIAPIHLSLNLNSAVFRITGRDISQSLLSLFLVCLSAVLFFRFYHLVKSYYERIRLSVFILFLTCFFYIFYLLFRHAYINYYYFAGSLLILWMTIVIRHSGESRRASGRLQNRFWTSQND